MLAFVTGSGGCLRLIPMSPRRLIAACRAMPRTCPRPCVLAWVAGWGWLLVAAGWLCSPCSWAGAAAAGGRSSAAGVYARRDSAVVCQHAAADQPGDGMQLGNARGLDIALATQQMQRAAALLAQSQVLWLPTIYLGTTTIGTMASCRTSSAMCGHEQARFYGRRLALSGLFGERRDLQPAGGAAHGRSPTGRQAAATNDNLLAVAEAYFDIQQARGELAGRSTPCDRPNNW